MARHKDLNWDLPEGTPNGKGGNTHSYDSILCALLMDIRDELKALNCLLNCRNFISIPRHLKAIRANTDNEKKNGQGHLNPKQ